MTQKRAVLKLLEIAELSSSGYGRYQAVHSRFPVSLLGYFTNAGSLDSGADAAGHHTGATLDSAADLEHVREVIEAMADDAVEDRLLSLLRVERLADEDVLVPYAAVHTRRFNRMIIGAPHCAGAPCAPDEPASGARALRIFFNFPGYIRGSEINQRWVREMIAAGTTDGFVATGEYGNSQGRSNAITHDTAEGRFLAHDVAAALPQHFFLSMSVLIPSGETDSMVIGDELAYAVDDSYVPTGVGFAAMVVYCCFAMGGVHRVRGMPLVGLAAVLTVLLSTAAGKRVVMRPFARFFVST